MQMRDKLLTALVTIALLAGLAGAQTPTRKKTPPPPPVTKAKAPAATTAPVDAGAVDYGKLARDVEMFWKRTILSPWYPRCVDTKRGGFNSNFDRAWKPGESGRFIVFQSRMTYAASHAAMYEADPALRDKYLPFAQHGLAFLRDAMWDKQNGGFFWQLDATKKVTVDLKPLYGQAFGLYATAAAYRATQDPDALDLAQQSFRWLEKNAYDKANGGYFESLNRAGKVATASDKPERGLGKPGQKSTNAQLHMLEALTELYRAWPDDLVKERTVGLIEVLRDKTFREPGYLVEVLTDDWKPVGQSDSYGHDIEGAHIFYSAADAVGMADDPSVRDMCRKLVDHVMAVGIDKRDGGVFGGGSPTQVSDRSKSWWAQYESANGLLLMHELYGHETPKYFEAFRKQWRLINGKLADRDPPGVMGGIRPSGEAFDGPKGSDWKAAYHETRCLTEIIRRLKRLEESSRADGPSAREASN